MKQSSVIVAAMVFAFVVYSTMRGSLPQYFKVLL